MNKLILIICMLIRLQTMAQNSRPISFDTLHHQGQLLQLFSISTDQLDLTDSSETYFDLLQVADIYDFHPCPHELAERIAEKIQFPDDDYTVRLAMTPFTPPPGRGLRESILYTYSVEKVLFSEKRVLKHMFVTSSFLFDFHPYPLWFLNAKDKKWIFVRFP